MLKCSRRAFLRGLSAASLGAAAGLDLRAQRGTAASPRIDARKLRERIEALSVFGRPAGGTFADGVSRIAYSDADVAGRRYVMGLMTAAGLRPRIDAAGNIFARQSRGDSTLPPILFGSHIDSVPSGGNFDGDLGSLSALGVIEALDAAGVRTRHPLEMVVWAHEEGFAFGRGLACSRIAAGDVTPADLDEVWNGMRRADAIRKIGGNPDQIESAKRARGSHQCYIELHIEQGGTLERSGTPIGVVEGIVAIDKYDAIVTGVANHAGTTPIAERHDALLAAAHLTVAVRDAVTRIPGRQVGTVGHIEVTPNSPNVIPGRAQISVELRDLSPQKLVTMMDDIRARAREIAANTQTAIEFKKTMGAAPAVASPEVQAAIERAAESFDLRSSRLPSGAGHDAQMMAVLGPMGMIFVPSVGGVSHSPKELTHWDDCARGADVLLRTILEMDKEPPSSGFRL
ncbi:MAG TPA: Zn-dependent hydrolase [Vicinamibacterales bacterium]|nr:Zn-dependent hydrolase [Vicinamibacterales bacterium]